MVTVKTGSEGLQDRQVIFVDQCHCTDLAVRIVSIHQAITVVVDVVPASRPLLLAVRGDAGAI